VTQTPELRFRSFSSSRSSSASCWFFLSCLSYSN